MIDGMSVLAVLVDCEEETWKSLCSQIGATRPILTWRGLDHLDRQVLPEICVPLSPAKRRR
jgi:acyl-homoserine lactone synthase